MFTYSNYNLFYLNFFKMGCCGSLKLCLPIRYGTERQEKETSLMMFSFGHILYIASPSENIKYVINSLFDQFCFYREDLIITVRKTILKTLVNTIKTDIKHKYHKPQLAFFFWWEQLKYVHFWIWILKHSFYLFVHFENMTI